MKVDPRWSFSLLVRRPDCSADVSASPSPRLHVSASQITIRSSCNGEWSTILHDVHASDFDWNAAAGVLACSFDGSACDPYPFPPCAAGLVLLSAGVLRDALRALGFEGATAEDIHLVASGQLLPQDAEVRQSTLHSARLHSTSDRPPSSAALLSFRGNQSLARVLRDLAWVQWNQQQAHLGAAEALNKQGKADVSAGDLESAATRFTEAVDRACKAGAPAWSAVAAALA